jgi:hypothetical protein
MVRAADQAERGDGGGDDCARRDKPRRPDGPSPGDHSLPKRQINQTYGQLVAGNDFHPYCAGLNAGVDRAGSVRRRRRRRRATAFLGRELAASGIHRLPCHNCAAYRPRRRLPVSQQLD